MSDEVCFAARMPARRAVCSGSPFFTAPVRIRRSASRDIAIDPRATASRAVAGFSPTSTIVTRPRASTCDSARALLRARSTFARWRLTRASVDKPAWPARPALLVFAIALSQKEREAFERNGEIDALQLHVGRRLECARRKIQDALDAG